MLDVRRRQFLTMLATAWPLAALAQQRSGRAGNGHMMMLEKNGDALAELVVSWIENG